MQMMQRDLRILLHNIRSAHNVGAIFRTSDAIGVSRIYLSGYTPAPVDRFSRPVGEIAKTALGAEKVIPWEYAKRPEQFLRRCKKENFTVVGIEQDRRAVDYKEYRTPKRVVILVGNEVRGISKSLRDRCDTLIEVPMRGNKESLNVSTAFGIVMFRLFDDHRA